MTAPTEKAAPIPADVWTAAKKALRLAEKCERHEDFARRVTYIARAIMQDRAERASQEERIREDERDRLYAEAEALAADLMTDAFDEDMATFVRDFLKVRHSMAPADRARLRGGAS